MTLPVEIHVGPEPILHKFEEVKLSKLGPMTSLQLTRRPLTRSEIARKRAFDLVVAALGTDRAHAAPSRRRRTGLA